VSDDRTAFDDGNDSAPRLFDLRYLIGGLFAVYGVVLVVASFFVDRSKAGGIDINLWLGIGMVALGAFFLAWARIRPLRGEGTSVAGRRDRSH